MLITRLHSGVLEAGLDEAGRGPLAGPVFAAAVILPDDFAHDMLDDSKKLTAKRRYALREVIIKEATAWAVASVSPSEIDRINILNASYKAMCMAVKSLSAKPELLLVDGNRFRSDLDIPFECKGRWQDRQHSRRIRIGQDIPRRLHDRFIEKISAIRMGTQQRISHSRTSAGNRPARSNPAPPTLLWSLRPHYPRNNRLSELGIMSLLSLS